jgi:hypothetical protein
MAIRNIEDTKGVIRSRESNGTVNAMGIRNNPFGIFNISYAHCIDSHLIHGF